MADVFLWLFLVVGVVVVLVATWVFAAAVHPAGVRAARERYRARPGRLLVRGALFTAPTALLGAALAGGGPAPGLRALGVLVLVTLVGVALVGAAGAATLVGAGMSDAGDAPGGWRATLRGGIVLALVALVPGPGWLLVLPALLLSGVGAASHGLGRARAPQPVTGAAGAARAS